jgi:hypothetical protein
VRTALRLLIYIIIACFAISSSALADAPSPDLQSTTISGAVLSGATGAVSVNQTSGNGNAQANVVLLASHASPTIRQSAGAAMEQSGAARIEGFAFSGSTGILQINQSAGAANVQANVVLLGDGALSAALPQQTATAPSGKSAANVVSVAKTAFTGARGIVQVSQAAGTANRTSNTFLLQVQGVAGH